MPILKVDLSDPDDMRAGVEILANCLRNATQAPQAASADTQELERVARAMTEVRRRKIWRFLDQVANLNVSEYSLPELGGHTGLSTNKVCSLKAILAKPEQRLGLQFFELAPSGGVDGAGNPRYRMTDAIRRAILAA